MRREGDLSIRVGTSGSTDRNPEVTARSLFAKSQRAEVAPSRRLAKRHLRFVRSGQITSEAAQMHHVDHCRGGTLPRNLLDYCAGYTQILAQPFIVPRDGQA